MTAPAQIEISDAELAARRHLCQHYWLPVYDRVRPAAAVIERPRSLVRCALCHVVKEF